MSDSDVTVAGFVCFIFCALLDFKIILRTIVLIQFIISINKIREPFEFLIQT
jgi:hypothetical protein